ncbi:MAG: class I SAM-dependent methyltransferase [Proteobacteria bacterium]|nr:class I SAM-dependent methyltransferase [Pseudomonadota bacterium]MBU4385084.1 class I SAM-dependent methyltransferase [Pseudomonadota bacterium]MBU4603715.1 class I SAM-dependent methyltransferase [Pseudomonadota bacterium]MCG2763206.1 class I SAM-dependent methyltransferase [Desulfarculaceae bacterium]
MTKQAPPPPSAATLLREDFWRDAWRGLRRDSFLKASQEASPQAWHQFYSRVSGIYGDLWGYDGELGRRVADLLISHGLAGPGKTVLDVGCGPGTLTLPLAKAGSRVIALDWSRDMLDSLQDQAAIMDGPAPVTVCLPWQEYEPPRPQDLVLASFFPDAFSAAGLTRLESWSRGKVALVMGAGKEAFAFRKDMWSQVLEVPFHDGGFHLTCAMGWLLAAGRRPVLSQLSWPATLDQPLEKVVEFYCTYFAIFGKQGPQVEGRIREVLENWRQGDRLRADGEVNLCVLWWEAPA